MTGNLGDTPNPGPPADEAVAAMQDLPYQGRKRVTMHLVQTLSPEDQQEVIRVLQLPGRHTNDTVWLIVISAFAIVLVGSFLAIAASAFVRAAEATSVQMILTLFTTAAAFLAGLLSPSPLQGAGRGGG